MSFPANINGFVSGYKDAMDFLHRNTSRTVTVYIKPLTSGCLNHSGWDFIEKRAMPIYNPNNPFSTSAPTVISSLGISGILNIPFSGGTPCPVCQGDGYINAPNSGVADARIKWTNKDTSVTHDDIKLVVPNADVRIKITGSAAKSLLDNAIKVDIDGYSCEMLKAGVPVGLRDIHTYYYFLRRIQ